MDQIEEVARSLHRLAVRVRQLGDDALAPGQMSWHSVAAEAFGHRLAHEAGRIRACGDDLDAASLAVARHHEAVQEAIRRLRGWP